MTTTDSLPISAGDILSEKYEVLRLLGGGWEGQVYHVRELSTGIERACKFFYPVRDPKNRLLIWYAKKLHKLRHCSIVIQYQTQEKTVIEDREYTYLVSEYVDGILLKEFLRRQPGRRLTAFQALHLLHALASGIETIHHLREYHGDLHADNIIVLRSGLRFSLKLVDMYRWSTPRQENIQDDVCDLIRIFYDAVGGKRFYAKQPEAIKEICCGLRRSLILGKFRTAGHLREFLEIIELEPLA